MSSQYRGLRGDVYEDYISTDNDGILELLTDVSCNGDVKSSTMNTESLNAAFANISSQNSNYIQANFIHAPTDLIAHTKATVGRNSAFDTSQNDYTLEVAGKLYAQEYLNLPTQATIWEKTPETNNIYYSDGYVRIGNEATYIVQTDNNSFQIIEDILNRVQYIITVDVGEYTGAQLAEHIQLKIRQSGILYANQINTKYIEGEKKFEIEFPMYKYLLTDRDVTDKSIFKILGVISGNTYDTTVVGTVREGKYVLKSNIEAYTLDINGSLHARTYPDCISQVRGDLNKCIPIFFVDDILAFFDIIKQKGYLSDMMTKYDSAKYKVQPLAANALYEIVKYVDARLEQMADEELLMSLLAFVLGLLIEAFQSHAASGKFNQLMKKWLAQDPAYRNILRNASGIDPDLQSLRRSITALATALATLAGAGAAVGGLTAATDLEAFANAVEDFFRNTLPDIVDSVFDNMFGPDDSGEYQRIDCRFNLTGWNCTKKAEVNIEDVMINQVEKFLEDIPVIGNIISFLDELFDIFDNNSGPRMISVTDKIFTESQYKCVGINCVPLFALEVFSENNPVVARMISQNNTSSVHIKANPIGPQPFGVNNKGLMLTNNSIDGSGRIDVSDLLKLNNYGNSARLAINAEVNVEEIKPFTKPNLSISGTDMLSAYEGSSNSNVCGMFLNNSYNGVNVVQKPSISIDMKAGNFFAKAYSSIWTGLSKGFATRYGNLDNATMTAIRQANVPSLYMDVDANPIDQSNRDLPYKYLRNPDIGELYPVFRPTFTLQKNTIGINNSAPDPKYALDVAGKIHCFQLISDYINVPTDGLEFTYGDPKLTVGFDASGNINLNGDIYKNRYLEITVDASASIVTPSGYIKCKVVQDQDLANYIIINNSGTFTKITTTKNIDVYLYNSNEEECDISGFYFRELTYDTSGNISSTVDVTSEIVTNHVTDDPKKLTLLANKTYVFRTTNTTWPSTAKFPSIFMEYRELYTSQYAPLSTVSSQWTTSSNDIYYNSGNVGIGAVTPAAKLHVNRKIFIEGQYTTRVKSAHSNITMLDKNFGIGCGQVVGVDSLYLYTFNGTDRDIVFSNTLDGDTDLSTNNWTHRMIIKGGTGNVGIGTIAPSRRLHVVSPNNNLMLVTTDTNNINQVSGIEFGIPNNVRSKIFTTTKANDKCDLTFVVQNGTNTPLTAVYISEAGNVGIGTTNPSYTLDVSGSANALTLYENGTALSSKYALASSTVSSQWSNVTGGIAYTSGTVNINSSNAGVDQQLFIRNALGRAGMILVPNGNTSQQCAIYTQNGDLMISAASNKVFNVSNPSLGYEAFRINGDGKVGIGLYNPANKLSINGNCSIGTAYATTAAPTDGLIVSGTVGINTTTPSYQLDVNGSTRFSNIANSRITVNLPAGNTGAYADVCTISNALSSLLYLDLTYINDAGFQAGMKSYIIPITDYAIPNSTYYKALPLMSTPVVYGPFDCDVEVMFNASNIAYVRLVKRKFTTQDTPRSFNVSCYIKVLSINSGVAITAANTSGIGYTLSTNIHPSTTLTQLNSRVGVLNDNPQYTLDVNGNANATALYENGVAISSKYALASSVTASQWTNSTGTLNTGHIYYNTGGILVGKTTIAEVNGVQMATNIGTWPKVDVSGVIQSTATNNTMYIKSNNIGETSTLQLGLTSKQCVQFRAININSTTTDFSIVCCDPVTNTENLLGFTYNEKTLIYGDAANRRVGINKLNGPAYTLDVNGSCAATSYVTTSDSRLKNIECEITDSLSKIDDIKSYKYTLKNDEENKINYGFIAQEVEAVFPELVHTNEGDGYKSMNYNGMIPVLLNAIKELKQKVEYLESKINV